MASREGEVALFRLIYLDVVREYSFELSSLIWSYINAKSALTGPVTEIVGGPDIYVDRGSTLNVTCAVAAGPKEPEFVMWSWKEKASA